MFLPVTTFATTFTPTEIDTEADRLLKALLHVDCEPGRQWNHEACRRIAPLTLEINRLKREQDAVILTHSYVEPEIIYGVGDFKGDSYFLSQMARDSQAKKIVFAGVVFMAETAKILSPSATVVVPDRGSGCSLADSITGEGVRRLKALYPDAAVVCYINSTAEVKAESDVCVTSGNVYDIVAGLQQKRILFVPDRLMADNVRAELKRRGVDKEIISSDGTCIVHDQFTAADITAARDRFPGLQVVAHPECTAEVAADSRFRRQHRRDDEIREEHAGAVFPHADRVRPRWPPAGGGSGETLHRRLPPLPLHEAQFAREGAPRDDRPAARPDHHPRRGPAPARRPQHRAHVRTHARRADHPDNCL
jgi:quinolinate synthase